MCPQAVKAIETDGNEALQTLPGKMHESLIRVVLIALWGISNLVVEKLTDNSEIDFQLIQPPVFGESYLETLHKVRYIWLWHG